MEDIINQLRYREPLFHQADLCSSAEGLDALIDADFWEVGASGTVYSREQVMMTVLDRFQHGTEPDTSQWQIEEFVCRPLGADSFQVTYLLIQETRRSRRLSIWNLTAVGWRVSYHQGTLVS